jgi:hypothetical protein
MYIISILILSFIFIGYAMYTAPLMDENGKILKPGKKLTDIFKRQK